jgi:hypothetical protein
MFILAKGEKYWFNDSKKENCTQMKTIRFGPVL